MENNYFVELNNINVNGHIEKKNNLSYLSWVWAWQEIKKLHPTAIYKIYERDDGRIYWDDGKTAWVKTGVTINNIEHIEYLPVMDFRNQSITVDKITSFDVNKTIQRSLTKACARHGLGLYIYAGEDLPEDEKQTTFTQEASKEKAANTRAIRTAVKNNTEFQRKIPNKPLSERYEAAKEYLSKQTAATFKNEKPSVIDSINNLVTDLNNSGCISWSEEIKSRFMELSDIEDFDFNFNGKEIKDYRV